MNVDTAIIDDIVKQVMEQLNSTKPAGSSSAPKIEAVAKPVVVDASDKLVITERVITAALLTEKLRNDTKTVVVSPKAVLTPTALELIKQRHLRYVREDVSAAGKSASTAKWRLIRSTTDKDVERCAGEVIAKSTGASTQLAGCSEDCLRQSASLLSRAEVDGVIALVRDPWSLACRANRQSKIRAVVLTHAGMLPEMRSQLGPNLLCVNPVGRPYFELRTLLTAALSSGKPTVPQGWRD